MFCLVNKKRKRKKILGTFGNNLLISYLSFWKYSKVFLWIIDKLNPIRNQTYLGDIIFETRLWKSLQYVFFLFHQFYCSIIYMQCMGAKLPQSCPTLRNPMNCNLPGSSVHGILQAGILEWVATSSSRGPSWPRGWTHASYISCTGRRVLYH